VHVRTRLDVDRDDVGAGLGKGLEIGIAGRAIIRCTSNTFLVSGRSALTTPGPIEMLGTKCPSITSTWIQSAPAASSARTSSPSLAKSADKIDGATMSGWSISPPESAVRLTRRAGRGNALRRGRLDPLTGPAGSAIAHPYGR